MQVLEGHRDLILNLVCDSLLAAVRHGESVFRMTPFELVRAGIRYPVRLFIKDEPHKLSKIRSGKLRLISGVALVDQVKERLLGSLQNNAEIDNWVTCSSKPGIGLDDESLLAMAGVFRDMLTRGPVVSMDVSGWDWSVHSWELFADAERRRRLAGAEKGSLFDFLLRVQAYCVSRSVFVLPNGDMVEQLDDGVQLSGSYWTSSTNSAMRCIATLVARQMAGHPVGPTDIVAMGDDSVERFMEGVKENLEKLGHRIKDVSVGHKLSDIEFCSHAWLETGLAIPVTAYKTLYRYFSHPPTSASYLDWYAQLLWVLRHFPKLNEIRDFAFARAERANNLYICSDGSASPQ